ncbi:MAG TPA: hypothetical protein VKV15_02085 [Bryobacteraceae bacterium]|nr:hypothetical protein [Bryobacteraceae bacterium]
MKPAPPPKVPGDTEWERFDNAFRKIITVSKEDLLKAEKKWKAKNSRKRARAKTKKQK